MNELTQTCNHAFTHAHIQPSRHSTRGPHKVHKWQLKLLPPKAHRQSRGKCMAFNRHISGPCVAIVLAHNRPTCGNQQVQKGQSRGTYIAVNMHRTGPCVAVVQAYKMHIHGNQKAHAWQSTGTYLAIDIHIQLYMAVNRHICSSHTHMVNYVAVVRTYETYRDGNKKEQKLV